MNNQHVAAVRITLKEDFGTEGRGWMFSSKEQQSFVGVR